MPPFKCRGTTGCWGGHTWWLKSQIWCQKRHTAQEQSWLKRNTWDPFQLNRKITCLLHSGSARKTKLSQTAEISVFTWDEELPFHELPRCEQGKAAFLHNHCMGQLTGNDPQFIPGHRTNLTGYSLPHCSNLLRGFWQSCINLLDYIWLYGWLCPAKVWNDSTGGMTDKTQGSSPSEHPAKQKFWAAITSQTNTSRFSLSNILRQQRYSWHRLASNSPTSTTRICLPIIHVMHFSPLKVIAASLPGNEKWLIFNYGKYPIFHSAALV